MDAVFLGEKAQKVLRDADDEAQELGYQHVKTCHLLSALTEAPGRGMRALNDLEVTRGRVHEVIAFRRDELSKIENGSVEVEIAGNEVCLGSHRVKEVVEEAQQEAWTYGRPRATPYDLLLALTKGRTGSTSDRVLDELCVPVAMVHSQVIRRRTEPHEHGIERSVERIEGVLTDIDAEVRHVDHTMTGIGAVTRHLDGGVQHLDEAVRHLDGGVRHLDGGVQHLDGE